MTQELCTAPGEGTKEMLTFGVDYKSDYFLPVSDPGIFLILRAERITMIVNLCIVFFVKENFKGKFAIEEATTGVRGFLLRIFYFTFLLPIIRTSQVR